MDKKAKITLSQQQLAECIAVRILDLALMGEQILAWEEEDITIYKEKKDTVITLLHRLREQFPNAEQRKRINSIVELLPVKEKHIIAILEDLQKLRSTYSLLQKRIPAIISTNRQQQEQLTRQIRQNYETDEKKTSGFLGLFRSKKKSRYQTERKNQEILQNTQSSSGTMLRSLANEIDRTRMENMEQLLAHVDSLSIQNSYLNNEMYRLIMEFNTTSQVVQQQKTDAYLHGQKRAMKTVSGLGVGAILLAFLFYLLLQRDLKKRYRTRMKLEASNKKNEELSLSRKNILLTVSHDLRAPLNTINGYAELLPEEKDERQRNRYAENILRASRHVIGLANNLLYYYRLEAGKEQPDKEVFHPGKLIEDVVLSFRPLADKKGLGLTAETEGVNTMVEGDCIRLTQILNNLLANAIKFTRKGHVHIKAHYRNGQLRFFVRDTGTGISKEKLEGIFTVFERQEGERTEPGFGLGLSITAKLVELLGGTISVESRPEHGSTFEVCLPMQEADGKETGKEPPTEYINLTGLKIILIDDDRMQADMTRRMLYRNGILCDCCCNVKELTELFRNNRYDLLLTDMQMPETDGHEVLKLLRNSNLGQSKDIPVLAVTAGVDEKTDVLVEAGFTGYLHKPFSKNELLAAVANCMGGRMPQGREADFSILLEGEDDRKGMLDMFVQDTEKTLADLQEAIGAEDYGKISALIHKGAPLWETIRIGIPAVELERLASLSSQAWNKALLPEVRLLAEAIVQAVKTAKRLREGMK